MANGVSAIIESLLVIAVSSMASICFKSCTTQAMIRSIGYIEMTMVFVVWLIYLMPQKKPYISEAKLRKILNPKNQPASKCWKMFHEKAVELFELGDWKGEYRDL